MITGSVLGRFRKNLLRWFSQFQRDLPWRRTNDPYRIWLSEIMLQQTRVVAALPYYERFVERFPDVRVLAEAKEEEVLRYWAGLGYYSRARNLHKAAKQIVQNYDSRFPKSRAEALALPGIGEYTAAAILSIAYGQKLAVLDGNVARVLARLRAVRGDLRAAPPWHKLQGLADELLAPQAPGDWNQAMMELGATVCTPRAPRCLLCPLEKSCEARKRGLSDILPEKRNKRSTVQITLASLVLLDSHERALLLPPPKAWANPANSEDIAALLSRLWHFPTILAREDAVKELRRYATRMKFTSERAARGLRALPSIRHTVTHRQITMQPFCLQLPALPRALGAKVLAFAELSSVPISNLTRKVAHVAMVTCATKVAGPGKRAVSSTKSRQRSATASSAPMLF